MTPMAWQWTGQATSTSPIPRTAASARWIRRGRSPRSRGRGSTASVGTGVRQPRRSSVAPVAWRWMGRATSTSPIAKPTVSARWIRRGRSPRLRGRGSTALVGTGVRRPRRSSVPPMAWRWMGRATSTSPIAKPTVSARWIRQERSPRLRGRGSTASVGTGVRRPKRSSMAPLVWRWTGQATSTSPIVSTIVSARWIRRERSPRSRVRESAASVGTGVRRPGRRSTFPMEWQWTGRATSTSPIPFQQSYPQGGFDGDDHYDRGLGRKRRLRRGWGSGGRGATQ